MNKVDPARCDRLTASVRMQDAAPKSGRFPNRAGDHADNDEALASELRAAGIPTVEEAEGPLSESMRALFRKNSGEVKTSVVGVLHGWTFKRAWYYWMASGPGIELAAADRLHASHGRAVRVAGHCGCPSPREWFKGLAVGSYHVDDADGLRALADCIKALVSAASEPSADAADVSQAREHDQQTAQAAGSTQTGEPTYTPSER